MTRTDANTINTYCTPRRARGYLAALLDRNLAWAFCMLR